MVRYCTKISITLKKFLVQDAPISFSNQMIIKKLLKSTLTFITLFCQPSYIHSFYVVGPPQNTSINSACIPVFTQKAQLIIVPLYIFLQIRFFYRAFSFVVCFLDLWHPSGLFYPLELDFYIGKLICSVTQYKHKHPFSDILLLS